MSQPNFKFELGVTLKSVIHGFEGVAMVRSEHITNCNQYLLQPPMGKDGKLPDAYWIDEHALVQTKAKPIVLPSAAKTGGVPLTGRREGVTSRHR